MGSMSIWHWIIVALIVMLLFGRGRISEMMGDLAKGIKSFKQGLADDETPPTPPQVSQQVTAPPPAQPAASEPAQPVPPESPRQ